MGTDQEGRRRKKRKAGVNQASGAESLNTSIVQLGSDTCPPLPVSQSKWTLNDKPTQTPRHTNVYFLPTKPMNIFGEECLKWNSQFN